MRAGPLGDADHGAHGATRPWWWPSSARSPPPASARRWERSRGERRCRRRPVGAGRGFVVRSGTEAGAKLARPARTPRGEPGEIAEAAGQVAAVRRAIGDPIPADGLPERLRAALDHPRWGGRRTLSRVRELHLVCPTCFCTSVRSGSDLDGAEATTERSLGQLLQPRFRRVAGDATSGPGFGPLPPMADPQVSTRWDQFGSPAGWVRPLHRLMPGWDRRPRGAAGDRSYRQPCQALSLPVLPADGRARGGSFLVDQPCFVTRSGRSPMVRSSGTRRRRAGTLGRLVAGGTRGEFVMVELPGFATRRS